MQGGGGALPYVTAPSPGTTCGRPTRTAGAVGGGAGKNGRRVVPAVPRHCSAWAVRTSSNTNTASSRSYRTCSTDGASSLPTNGSLPRRRRACPSAASAGADDGVHGMAVAVSGDGSSESIKPAASSSLTHALSIGDARSRDTPTLTATRPSGCRVASAAPDAHTHRWDDTAHTGARKKKAFSTHASLMLLSF